MSSNRLVCIIACATWICLHIATASGRCLTGEYGLDCSYTCHCRSGCDDVTGCSGDCNKGWFGPTCNKNNIALEKQCYQSSYFSNWWLNSSNAVDGIYKPHIGNGKYCILTDVNQPFTWWEVDLGSLYYIHNLAVYFRTDFKYRRNGVTVYSSIQANQINGGHRCGSANKTSSDIIQLTCDDTARYITLYQETNNTEPGASGTMMDFCEVEVYVCDPGTFGENCTDFCHCRTSPCNYTTGECSDGCKQNWTGKQCNACDSGHYGNLCESDCSSRHCDETDGKSSCDVTGTCDNQCDPGWRGGDCLVECSVGRYGKNCTNSCYQRHCLGVSSCNHVTGKCDHGCKQGYQSQDCTTPCPDGRYYGYNCNMSCDARNCSETSTCDRVSGTCTRGCLSGWQLPDCTTECRHGTYGPSCRFRCSKRHCKGDSAQCDVQHGVCSHGCQAGWKNANCTEECNVGWYGAGCVFECSKRHCRDKPAACSRVDGSCGGECDSNYIGVDCTECNGSYGENCSLQCTDRHCKNSNASCDAKTGSCGGQCQAGWNGNTCTDKSSTQGTSPSSTFSHLVTEDELSTVKSKSEKTRTIDIEICNTEHVALIAVGIFSGLLFSALLISILIQTRQRWNTCWLNDTKEDHYAKPSHTDMDLDHYDSLEVPDMGPNYENTSTTSRN